MNSGPANAAVSSPAVSLKRDEIRTLAHDAGFAEAGLVALPHRDETRDAERFNHWIREGRSGSMRYLSKMDERGTLIRSRVSVPFPWARSAVVCMASYHSALPKSTDPASRNAGWIARYAWSSRMHPDGVRRPSDYHKVLLRRLKKLDAHLHERFAEIESRCYVDTGPVVERALATAAGLGWTAKNTCILHPQLGSYLFLGVILTSLPVEPDAHAQLVPDRCGTCTRCLDACPTNALTAPREMDAAKCISYLTIEHRGEIAPELMDKMGRQIFGCDICQDVCPWNRKAPLGADTELQARPELVNPPLAALAAMSEPDYERMFNGSPVRRARFHGLRRNLAIAMGNSGESSFEPLLRAWAGDADTGVRNAAQWALKKLQRRGNSAENHD